MGARQSAGSTSGTVYHPPVGKGDAVSRVRALSPPGTTDWAACGRRVSGAWSVAPSPPPPSRTALLPESSARGPASPHPRGLTSGTYLGRGAVRGLGRRPQRQPQQLVRDPWLVTGHAKGGQQHITQPAHLIMVVGPPRLV